MASIDINRTTTISLPAAVSSEILQKTQEASAVMAMARQIPLPGLGVRSEERRVGKEFFCGWWGCD